MMKSSTLYSRSAPVNPWWSLLTRLKMAQRLGMVLGIILLLFLLVAAVGYWGTSSTRNQAVSFVDTKLSLSQQVAQVRLSLARSRAFEKDVILFLGDNVSVGKAKASWQAEQKELNEGLQNLGTMLAGLDAEAQLDGIKQRIKGYQTRFTGILTQVEMGALDNAMAANRLMRAVNADVEAASNAMNQIGQAVAQQANTAKVELETRYQHLLRAGAVIVLLALALAAVLGWATTLSVVTPLREGQTRIYSHRDKIRLKLTLRGKRLGFSLAEIRELFDMYDTDKSSKTQLHSMIQLIDEKRDALRQQLEDIQMVMAELEAAEQRCVNSLNSLKTGAD